ncbi:MAG: TonB-dependent receptor [Chitinophagales bacterium]|nr:TonB-dependent receptor [Chitinophagales bacterium]
MKGSVKNSRNGEAITGAIVRSADGQGTSTDALGNYKLIVNAGNYTITFSHLGYAKQQKTISLIPDQILILNADLNEDTSELNLIVISASKYNKQITDETVSMEVLKPDFIHNTNAISMDQALEKVPGVTIIDNQANIRGGSGFSYGAGSRVMVLVDDIPELTGDANDVKWEFLPIENLNQVEIIKGASSVLYGSSALNGVINIRTAYPVSKPETRINIFQGLYINPPDKNLIWWQNKQPYFNGGNFSHSRRYHQFDLVLGGNVYNESSFHEGEFTQRGRINANTRYRFKNIGLSAGINTNLMYYQSGTYFLWANDTTGALRPLGGLDTSTTTLSEGKNTRFNLDPFVTFFSPNGGHHDLRLRYFYTKNNNNTSQGAVSNWYYSQYLYQKIIFHDISFTAGAVGSYSVVTAELYGNHLASNFAIFTQVDKKIGRLNAVAGLRYETFKVDSFTGNSRPVFRAGINYQLLKGTYLRASFGQGYRFPSIAEKYISTSVGALKIFPNPGVQPEKGWSADIGLKQALKIGNWLSYLDLSGFTQRYSNLIEFKFGYYPPELTAGDYDFSFVGFKSINIGNASITGIELSVIGEGNIGNLKTNLLAGIDFISPINRTQKKLVDSIINNSTVLSNQQVDSLNETKILNYRFKTTAKFNVELSYNKFSAGAEMRYNSYMVNVDPFFEGTDPLLITLFEKPTELIPGVKEWRNRHKNGDYIIDFRLSYDIVSSVRISLISKNLLNRTYSIRPALLEAPQNFQLQVTVKI